MDSSTQISPDDSAYAEAHDRRDVVGTSVHVLFLCSMVRYNARDIASGRAYRDTALSAARTPAPTVGVFLPGFGATLMMPGPRRFVGFFTVFLC